MSKSAKGSGSKKLIFVVEDDRNLQKEIQAKLSHQHNWKFEFFEKGKDCLDQLHLNPMAVFVDLEHSSITPGKHDVIPLIDQIHAKNHNTKILVFSDHESQSEAAEVLKHGAFDYIVINEHQFVKMEYELKWLEEKLDEELENQKLKKYVALLGIAVAAMVGFLMFWYWLQIS